MAEFSCPVCLQNEFDLSNMGFINCEWALKGQLRNNSHIKIYADGQTYDEKLYTFQELNYKKEFNYLNIFVKRHEGSVSQNQSVKSSDSGSSSQGSDKVKKLPP